MAEIAIWDVRHFIYQHFAATAKPPTLEEIGAHFAMSQAEVEAALLELHAQHALFLQEGTLDIVIANPFSGVSTDFLVDVDGQTYYANCAWDSFGVIAALGAANGRIRANCAHTGEPLSLGVKDDEVVSAGEQVHFLVPFAQWYADMVFT